MSNKQGTKMFAEVKGKRIETVAHKSQVEMMKEGGWKLLADEKPAEKKAVPVVQKPKAD